MSKTPTIMPKFFLLGGLTAERFELLRGPLRGALAGCLQREDSVRYLWGFGLITGSPAGVNVLNINV
jgi:hypothetical protein